ncbi:uncharacterized protein B0P05DRAFT_566881 [Gilbertella persicaria]|uniref:uncharacterized protein n=1 Tax=Gilbertella persicaria TaxID=101096 RepID=UPI00221F7391|nr:uncharacterized protein B0P05DRAFT_566881 [Gilbertella persicaria]KAI8047097.1 hypothetical protein B0P05DRAFT_566881 [Gilbertella persicaria]
MITLIFFKFMSCTSCVYRQHLLAKVMELFRQTPQNSTKNHSTSVLRSYRENKFTLDTYK